MHIVDGWLQGAIQRPSPNFNQRPEVAEIDTLVIHNISLPPKQFGGGYIEQFFQNCLDPQAHPYFVEIAGLEVSAHVLISREGGITQFVSFDQRAWHAGVSEYCGRSNCNDFSIGIELEGADDVPYSAAQYQSLSALTKALLQTYPRMSAERIVGHCDIAPERKTDPGEAFDWSLYKQSLQA